MASTGVVDLSVVYQFIRRLATPFIKWEAYKTGVINERGDIILKQLASTIKGQRPQNVTPVLQALFFTLLGDPFEMASKCLIL